MGQYHHPVCIEAEEGLTPHGLGDGLKEGEHRMRYRQGGTLGQRWSGESWER